MQPASPPSRLVETLEARTRPRNSPAPSSKHLRAWFLRAALRPRIILHGKFRKNNSPKARIRPDIWAYHNYMCVFFRSNDNKSLCLELLNTQVAQCPAQLGVVLPVGAYESETLTGQWFHGLSYNSPTWRKMFFNSKQNGSVSTNLLQQNCKDWGSPAR